MMNQITPEQRAKLLHPIHAETWRAWSNPEVLLRPSGLRLEELDESVATSILVVLKAAFSPEGYEKALTAMRINQFLGEICHMPKIMNKYSYNFLVFGNPSTEKAWGWSLYGHHLCIKVFLLGPQVAISPTFAGAEPNIIDEGEFSGTSILQIEGNLGLKLIKNLPDMLKEEEWIFKLLRDLAWRRRES